MAKQGEIDYLAKSGPDGARHAAGKPFTDADCGPLLANMAGLFMVLPAPPARVLDLGCGSGWTTVLLARRGYDVVGQDIAPDMIALAESNRAESKLPNLSFTVCDYESLDLREAFDAAVFHDALHHAVDPEAALASAWRALKPGGIVVTLEPGAGHAESEAARRAMAAFDVTERDMPPSLIEALGRRAGFVDPQIYAMPRVLVDMSYGRLPAWCPRALRPLYRLAALAWLTIVARRKQGAMMVLRKPR